MKNTALILASGTGSRCELGFPKQFANICGKTVLEHTIKAFETHNNIDEIYIVTSKNYIQQVQEFVNKGAYKKVKKVIEGGKTRKDSSYNGIFAINDNEANILIHDGVRPLISNRIISECIEQLSRHDAVCTTVETSDTIYITGKNGVIKSIPERKNLKRAQTPQCFKLSLIKKAHELAKNDINCSVTDDCGLIMYYNLADIYTINGDINNIKITYPQDISFAETFLSDKNLT
ncbi:MAG: 2-C-methyl-D-erythritol 4-phosphate cytidylyltransferase [Candidatus Gastranaerophilales bacterium]|nr:2-C-methyl-D-erythritol 4-phosphate cytidylyltransferase [Candidatus Gastranaerophilales bacterium]